MLGRENLKDCIVKAIASYQDEILDFTRSLVRIPTENPPGRSYKACVEAIAGKLREIGLEPTILEVPEVDGQGLDGAEDSENLYPRYCLLTSYGMGAETLYFHGHYDVVPAANKAQFRSYVEDGRLFGRGAADMKSGLAAMIYAVKAIMACDVDLKGRLGLTIVPDEETGGVLGAGYLAEAGLLGEGGIGVIVGEPTSGLIWNASRGTITLRITVRGKPAHVCTHYEGVNAFEQMLVVANALRELKSEVEARQTQFKIEPEEARYSILMMGGRSEGGINFNAVPEECWFTVDRRLNPEEDFDAEKRRLFTLFDRLKERGIDLDVEILQEGKATGFSEDGPVARALAASVEAVTGKPASFEMCPGFLESRFYAQGGIPGFGYGPGLLSVSHGPDEFVRLQEVYDCAAVYALCAVRLLAARR